MSQGHHEPKFDKRDVVFHCPSFFFQSLMNLLLCLYLPEGRQDDKSVTPAPNPSHPHLQMPTSNVISPSSSNAKSKRDDANNEKTSSSAIFFCLSLFSFHITASIIAVNPDPVHVDLSPQRLQKTRDIGRRFALWKSVEKTAESFSGLLDDLHSLFLDPAFFRIRCRFS